MADPGDLPFNGVHAIREAIEEGEQTPVDEYPNFTGWEVESTLCLIWSFGSPECEGRIVEGCYVANYFPLKKSAMGSP